MQPGTAIKRFVKCEEWQPPDIAAQREWRALALVDKYAPGLAPTPVEADLAGPEPTVIMSRLAGTPLRGISVRPEQLTAMAHAVITLHQAIPPHEVAGLSPRVGPQRVAVQALRAWGERLGQSRSSPVVAAATSTGLAWLARSELEWAGEPDVPPVFGQADGNLENFLWDGSRVRIVDFEYSGSSDRAYELADITEHVSSWVDTEFDAPAFLEHFDLTGAEAARLRDCRRLFALSWLKLLRLQDRPHSRNPAGTVEKQAQRLLDLLD
jgi:thiamine kinase-like enzyme